MPEQNQDQNQDQNRDQNKDQNQNDKSNQQQNSAEDKTPKDQLKEITVDGEKKYLTNDEVTKYAQLGFSSDKRYKDATTKEKSAEDGLRIQGLVQRLGDSENQPTDVEIKELAALLKIDASEFTEYLKPEADPKTEDKLTKVDPKALAEALGMDPAEAKMILELSKQGLVASEREKITKNSHLAVDKDEFFGKIKVGKGGDGILEAVKEMVAEDVFERIEHGGAYGAELVAASIQKVRAHLIKMGIPGKPDEHPIVLGLVPGGAVLPAEVTGETPIERISSAEDKGEDNFVKRYLQKAVKAARDIAAN